MPRDVKTVRKIAESAKNMRNIPQATAVSILNDSDDPKISTLSQAWDFVKSITSSKSKHLIESLKLTAIENRVYSLAANQIALPWSIFIMHKNVRHNLWTYPKDDQEEIFSNHISMASLDKPTEQLKDLPMPEIEFTPESFNVYANPKIVAISDLQEYDWERWTSYPGRIVQVKRPLALRLSYQDELGDMKENDFIKFEARMICHNVDHLNGVSIVDWNISEGTILIESSTHADAEAIKAHVNTYGSKISDYKKEHPESFNRENKITKEYERDGIKWKEHKDGYPKYKKSQKDIEFSTDYMVDMYEAANKDKRKKELKDRYFTGK